MIWKLIVGGLWKPIAAVFAGLAAYFKGRNDAANSQKRKDLEQKVETLETAKEVKNAVEAKSDAAVRADLGRWVRPE